MARKDGVTVTRFDHTDYGTEIRVEIRLGGRTAELICCDGINGYELDLIEHGPYLEEPYKSMIQHCRVLYDRT